ncbi:MAG: extracellular solute-binding protein [Propionibacteriales bacterium]|nr:extracellular solute-binding protein [Propionibacteriales bacterium]
MGNEHIATLTRRSVLGLAAAAVAGGVVGCRTSTTGADFGGNDTLTLPNHIAPKPVEGAIVSAMDGVPAGLTAMPNPLPTSTSGPPGSGKEFTTFQINWGSPARPYEQNEYWQEFNKRLNVDYKPTLVPADAYDTRLATVLSSGQIPDMTFLHTTSANAQQAIQDGAFAELSSVLGGDKIEQYPNLANVPTYQWEASAINNGLYGIPCDLPYVNATHLYRRDWAAEIGLTRQPKDADEFKTLMTEISKTRGRYGLGGFSGGVSGFVNAMFRVPNNWRDEGGKLINHIETDEYEQALGYLRELWQGGAFHPDALPLAEQGAKDRELFESGVTSWQVGSADHWYMSGGVSRLRAKNPKADVTPILPMGHDGGKYTFWSSPGFYALIAISAQAAENEERLGEILRIMNYLRAPIASEEGFFLRYGTEGIHFSYDDNRYPVTKDSPAPTDRDAMFYTGMVPVIFYYPDPQDVRDTMSYTEEVTRNTVKDPTVGLFAPSSASSAAKLEELTQDYVNGIVSGRRPPGDLQRFRDDWRQQGGDKLRQELMDARAK